MNAANVVAQKLYDSLSFRPYCGYEKCAYLIRSKKNAVRYPFIVVNLPQHVSWLTFDIDHSDLMIWESVGLPAPNFIVRDPKTGKGHITYAIESVCRSPNARKKPLHYLKAIQRTMTRLLQADSAFSNYVTKNPLSASWVTTWIHDKNYSLSELHEHLPNTLDKAPYRAQMEIEDLDYSMRNHSVFNAVRFWAYKRVHVYRKTETELAWEHAVLDQACAIAEHIVCPIRGRLGANEIACIARSIARWTWHHYHSVSNCRGVMGLDKNLHLSERQKLAAQHTHEVRRECSELKIRQAIQTLKSQNKKVTKSAVAELTGLSRQQITRAYRELFDSVSKGKDLSFPKNTTQEFIEVDLENKGRDFKEKSVNYAVHQVTALKGYDENNKTQKKSIIKRKGEERSGFFEKIAFFDSKDCDEHIFFNKNHTDNHDAEEILVTRFDRIDDLLDWMLKLPKLDNLPQPFDFEMRLSLAMLLVDESQLTQDHCIDVILKIMAKALEESPEKVQSFERWRPYAIKIGQRILRDHPQIYRDNFP